MLEEFAVRPSILRFAFSLPLVIWLSIHDIRYHQVHPPAVAVLLLGTLVYNLLFRMDIFTLVEAAVLGLMVLALSVLLRGKVGAGDVKLLYVFALLFEPDIWSAGLLISGWLGLFYVAVAKVASGKSGRALRQSSEKVPFVPFLAGGYAASQIVLMII